MMATTRNGALASALVVVVERDARTCRYASAGHDIGLVAGARSHRHLVPTGPVLGIVDDATFFERVESFGPCDLLVLATDGFTECRNKADSRQQFGTHGIVRALLEGAGTSCKLVARAVAQNADAFTGGCYRDDATLAVIGCGVQRRFAR